MGSLDITKQESFVKIGALNYNGANVIFLSKYLPVQLVLSCAEVIRIQVFSGKITSP